MQRSNVVYTSNALSRYPKVRGAIVATLAEHGLEHRSIEGTSNIWCRDYMPVPTPTGLVKFNYKGYGDLDTIATVGGYANYPQLVVPDDCWRSLPNLGRSDIILDAGGNCACSEHLAVITDVVYRHNPRLAPKAIRQALEDALGLDVLIVPREPGDDLGHTDGILKWIDNFACFVNDYSTRTDPVERAYGAALNNLLRSRGIEPVPFPYGYMCEGFAKCPEAEFRLRFPDADDYNPAPGYWINFLFVEGLVVLPAFNHPRDDEAARKIEEYLDVDVVQVDCSDLCQEGGLINCVCWSPE